MKNWLRRVKVNGKVEQGHFLDDSLQQLDLLEQKSHIWVYGNSKPIWKYRWNSYRAPKMLIGFLFIIFDQYNWSFYIDCELYTISERIRKIQRKLCKWYCLHSIWWLEGVLLISDKHYLVKENLIESFNIPEKTEWTPYLRSTFYFFSFSKIPRDWGK